MKKIFLIVFTCAFSTLLYAQAPAKFNYQGIARNADGSPIAGRIINLRLSILEGNNGAAVYTETNSAITNAYGLYTVAVGGGKSQTGAMNKIAWGTGEKYIKVEIDPNGGNNYVTIGNAQLLSVPFALYAAASGTDKNTTGREEDLYWKLLGNGGTDPDINFLGTTDNTKLVIRTNNKISGFLDPNNNNVALGTEALFNNPGNNMVAVGDYALYNQTTNEYGQYKNTALGSKTLYSNTTGIQNTATGYHAMYSNTTGNYNVANGDDALSSNSTGEYNTALGSQSLFSNTTGNFNTATGFFSLKSNTTGFDNTANGTQTLQNNTTGFFNTAMGLSALYANTTGNDNTALGSQSLAANTTGTYNTANGSMSLYANTTGYYNTAIGYSSLLNNTTGYYNTASGVSTLYSNTTGNFNTGTGINSLYFNTTGAANTATGNAALAYTSTGGGNTANGYNALFSNTTGNYNTAIGYNANVSTGALANATAIGNGATVDASNKVRVGNTSVTSIGGQVSWTSFSDGRYKSNIREDVHGLDFILQLKPVTYNFDRQKLEEKFQTVKSAELEKFHLPTNKTTVQQDDMRYSGFIAQDVEKAAQKIGYDFSGVDKPADEKGTYGLRYAEFVVPLIKAVQEQQAIIETLKKEVAELKATNKQITFNQ